jgi:hypothetical protein
MASKVEQILAVIRNSHVMGEDGLRDYHAARAARDANRKGTTQARFSAMKTALKNHRVTVSLDSGMGTIRIRNNETRAEYTAHP